MLWAQCKFTLKERGATINEERCGKQVIAIIVTEIYLIYMYARYEGASLRSNWNLLVTRHRDITLRCVTSTDDNMHSGNSSASCLSLRCKPSASSGFERRTPNSLRCTSRLKREFAESAAEAPDAHVHGLRGRAAGPRLSKPIFTDRRRPSSSCPETPS